MQPRDKPRLVHLLPTNTLPLPPVMALSPRFVSSEPGGGGVVPTVDEREKGQGGGGGRGFIKKGKRCVSLWERFEGVKDDLWMRRMSVMGMRKRDAASMMLRIEMGREEG